MATNTSTVTDVVTTRDDGADTPPHPQFETVVADEAESQVVFRDRENATAWIAMDADAVRSREELR
ncbi:hypothetical protein RBH26_09210 [Natronolimnohabitans sp. A-GB9]|uniref:DUF7331 family protein n=1 Tax=Natronolimnohabitans sp. A-GB9 TaxID=3069757 RepID=UPI0027B02452|nr:hypothetical protein [Natronolimnohabitans sp. A-GB9]MDQ2050666.1 hypothetical protein [Natronolimnohabitans sp. A-GB9]